MTKINWITQSNYDHKKNKVPWDIKRDDPEAYGLTEQSVKKQTVPGQSVSIKEIMKRYESGRPKPTNEK